MGDASQSDNDLLRALGKLVVACAGLETNITLWLALLIPASVAKVVLADLDFRRKLDLVLALCRENYPGASWLAELEALASESHQLYSERNGYIHAEWNHALREVLRTSNQGGRYKLNRRNVEPANVDQLAERCAVAADRLMELAVDASRTIDVS